jgi:tRNA U34 5-methylaminomethyl-2-thiouridine-forming methyltransferase MnmC
MVTVPCEQPPEFEIVTLKGGERSIRSIFHGETMHIGTGPRSEALALHIDQPQILRRLQEWGSSTPFVIWDVGLGPAGNALTLLETLKALRGSERPVAIHSFEISTAILTFALQHADKLSYLAGWEKAVDELLHCGMTRPLPHVDWHLHIGDFRDSTRLAPPPASIFHDPYSPAKNPEMWSLETFRLMRDRTDETDAPPCLLTNYTRSTAVRVTLALAGWFVGTGVPTGEKTETTIASNRLDLLERPLDRDWLKRVRGSTNAAPFRNGLYAPGPISREDLAALEALPQFG